MQKGSDMATTQTTPTEKATGPDQRRNARYRMDVRIRAMVPKDGKRAAVHGRANDISESGMAMFLPHVLQPNERIEVEFTLPYSRQPLLVGVLVRHRNGYRYGVEFVTLTAHQRDEIGRLCQALTLLQ